MVTTNVTPQGLIEVGGSASVDFSPGGGHVDADVTVLWDFNNDGNFDDPLEDITSYVISVDTSTGRDWPSNLYGQTNPGQMRITLDNRDDRFSYFNTDSPLTTGGLSLRTGRKIRLGEAGQDLAGPALLARDRFDREDGPLEGTQDELGNTWFEPVGVGSGGVSILNGQAAATSATAGTLSVAIGATEGYAEIELGNYLRDMASSPSTDSHITVLWRVVGLTTSVYLALYHDRVDLTERVAGVPSVLATYPIVPWDGMTIGLLVDANDLATAYINGVSVMAETTSAPATGDAGFIIDWDPPGQTVSPTVSRFEVWSDINTATDGVLWTGLVDELSVDISPGGLKTATVTAVGTLARAAGIDVLAPKAREGASTGILIGDVLSRANLLKPPSSEMAEGDITTGPVYLEDGNALNLARQFEATEFGFLYETPEGPVGFQSRSGRELSEVTAWFSDTAGVGQFGFSTFQPLNFQREVANYVVAGVTADPVSGITIDTSQGAITSAGVANHVQLTMPACNDTDLVIVIINSTVQTTDVEWREVLWWTSYRDAGDDFGTRVYATNGKAANAFPTPRFYTDSGNSGGAWNSALIVIEDWYTNQDGLVVAEVISGRRPPSLAPPWGRQPALWFAFHAGFNGTGGTASGSLADHTFPQTYEENVFVGGSDSPVGDIGLQYAWKYDVTGAEWPTSFDGLENFTTYESGLLCVRGYNGPITDVTFQNPSGIGGEGRFVLTEDLPSQDDHNAVIQFTNSSNLFATEADAEAYNEVVLSRYADDRPIMELSYFATTNAANRAQAIARRVGDKIKVTATGDTGYGADGEFFIENISHRITNGAKLWEVTWQLSPA